jgi:hypothetical protein
MMAHPFLPMTTKQLKKLTRINRESISATEFSEPRFVFEIPKIIPTEELNSQKLKTNQSQSPP